MKLKTLHIEEIPSYKDNAGQYEGKIVFYGATGTVSLNLSKDHCEQIFAVCADAIISTAKEAASFMTCEIIEHKQALLGEPS